MKDIVMVMVCLFSSVGFATLVSGFTGNNALTVLAFIAAAIAAPVYMGGKEK